MKKKTKTSKTPSAKDKKIRELVIDELHIASGGAPTVCQCKCGCLCFVRCECKCTSQ